MGSTQICCRLHSHQAVRPKSSQEFELNIEHQTVLMRPEIRTFRCGSLSEIVHCGADNDFLTNQKKKSKHSPAKQ